MARVRLAQTRRSCRQVYLTGAFMFSMMYTGSNILPLCKLLEIGHTKQAFRTEEEQVHVPHSVVIRRYAAGHSTCAPRRRRERTLILGPRRFRRARERRHPSILGPLLPTAMLCYLENYGGAKFAEVFLGDFDTPEVIWSHEMRRFMVEKLAMHLSEFTPRYGERSEHRVAVARC